MSYDADLFIKACADPHGLSDSCYPDGTPMTNREKYLRNTSREYDGFH